MTAERHLLWPVGHRVFFVRGRFSGLTGVVRAYTHIGKHNLHIVDFDSPTDATGPYAEVDAKELTDVDSKLAVLGQRTRSRLARLAAWARPIFHSRAPD